MLRIFSVVFGVVFYIGACCAAPIQVVVSITPLQAFVQGIGGEHVSVTELVPANMSVHTYALRPSDQQALAKADLIVWIGPILETFLEKAIQNNQAKKQRVINFSENASLHWLPLRTYSTWENSDVKLPTESLRRDPHIWLDPQNAQLMLKEIAQVLIQMDPAHKSDYENNLKQRTEELSTLEAKLGKELMPLANRPFMVFHDGFQYFEKRFGLNNEGMIVEHEDIPLSIKQLQAIHQKIVALKIVCVFKEPDTSQKLADVVVRGTQAKLGLLDPLEGGAIVGWEGYPTLLSKNAASLKACLAP